MEHTEFEKIYHSDPIMFHLGLDLFANYGRFETLYGTEEALRANAIGIVSGYFEEHAIRRIMQLAKGFAGLSSMDFLACAARCDVRLEDETVDTPGVCPLCGGHLIYGEDASVSSPHAVGWTCEACGATGKEAYREVFDCHYDVHDSTGNLVVERNQKK